jgi:signal transduction histidine kinase
LVSIGEETDRLTQLAEDLLLLARVDQGKLLLHAEELDVRTLLDGIAVRYGRRSAALGRRIHVEGGEAIVVADRFRLEQAIANLVENALRHGRGDVVLKADAGADSVEVAVTDEGPGIPHALAPRVFDRFARDDDARPRGGAGLGLAIVKAITEAHGGTAVVAEGESGAEIRLLLPRVRSAVRQRAPLR